MSNLSDPPNVMLKAIQESNRCWWPIIRQNWGALLVITIFVQIHAQFFLYMGRVYQMDDLIRTVSQLGLGTISLIEAVFLVMLVPLRIEELSSEKGSTEPFWPFFKKYIGPLTVEGLRMTAFVILWALLFILPGIYKQIRWYFMPFIVMFDANYEKGEVDCLDRSSQLTKGIFILLALLMLVDFGVQQGLDSFALSAPESLQPLSILFAGLLTMGVSIYTYSLYYWIYKQRVNQVEYHAEPVKD